MIWIRAVWNRYSFKCIIQKNVALNDKNFFEIYKLESIAIKFLKYYNWNRSLNLYNIDRTSCNRTWKGIYCYIRKEISEFKELLVEYYIGENFAALKHVSFEKCLKSKNI